MLSPTRPANNLLLESLPLAARDALLQHITLVEWKFGEIVCESNQAYEYIYFPVTGFVSQHIVLADNHPLEMGLIGNEGMVGANLVLGVNNIPLQLIVQGSGTAFSIPVQEFQRLLLDFPDLVSLLMRYIYVLIEQLCVAGACLHFHDMESRLARWLLMTHDRSDTDILYLTHAFLAYTLGVRRSSVSLAAETLQRKHFISYSRGKIKILERKGLEASSCPCYQAMTDSYLRFIG